MRPATVTHAELWVDGAPVERHSAALQIHPTDLGPSIDRPPLIRTLTVVVNGPHHESGCTGLLHRTIDNLPNLKAIVYQFIPAPSLQDFTRCIELQGRCIAAGLSFTVEFVLDGNANAYAWLCGLGTTLPPVVELSRTLRHKAVDVRWRIPLVPDLIYRLEALYSFAKDEGIDPLVTLAPSLSQNRMLSSMDLDEAERLFAWDFVTYRLLEEERPHLSRERIANYEWLAGALTDGDPGYAGVTHTVAVIVPITGRGESVHQEVRPGPSVPPGKRGSEPTRESVGVGVMRAVRHAMEVGGVLLEGCRALVEWIRSQVSGVAHSRPQAGIDGQFPRLMIIGAYGGDHIGDTAILGGVLLRAHERYGTTRAILMSQRPRHTRHLVGMLDTPVEVTVEEYRQSMVRSLLRHVDAVVYAGGPLMDIPKQLVKHLYTVSLARQRNKPFLVEGIGVGPFIRKASEWIARRLLLMADRVELRTHSDGASRLVRGIEPHIGRDPAFDYLQTRGTALTRFPQVDRNWIDRLMHDTAGRRIIGINLRPIRHDFTMGVSGRERLEYTRFIETRFEERLAEALRRLHDCSTLPPCFVFFPMNAIQFGKSDLRSAYRIKRLLRDDLDLRIWEGDPSIDGIVDLLRKFDLVVTMRFHATVFALAQARRVVGIDYRIGKGYKVAALLRDAGRSGDCARIDTMTTDWLFERLAASGYSTNPAVAELSILVPVCDKPQPQG